MVDFVFGGGVLGLLLIVYDQQGSRKHPRCRSVHRLSRPDLQEERDPPPPISSDFSDQPERQSLSLKEPHRSHRHRRQLVRSHTVPSISSVADSSVADQCSSSANLRHRRSTSTISTTGFFRSSISFSFSVLHNRSFLLPPSNSTEGSRFRLVLPLASIDSFYFASGKSYRILQSSLLGFSFGN
ncbi:hypothetical protein PIB30_066910 [Stylosanthes scabra]|uniref:Uncharacterized protein n=1 Tax=Stylosanthes scabra TaxID=79078 RepID=A0ABU6ZL75_9FABA|nr:hypothetical protein [Stylosanthes scabra]